MNPELEKFKLSVITWDSGKDPGDFQLFMDRISPIVRQLGDGGDTIETFLDHVLKRDVRTGFQTPKFITENPAFQLPDLDPELQEDEVDHKSESQKTKNLRKQLQEAKAQIRKLKANSDSEAAPGEKTESKPTESSALNTEALKTAIDTAMKARKRTQP